MQSLLIVFLLFSESHFFLTFFFVITICMSGIADLRDDNRYNVQGIKKRADFKVQVYSLSCLALLLIISLTTTSRGASVRLYSNVSTSAHPALLKVLFGVNDKGRVIVTSTTCGYLDFTLNWIHHVKSSNLTNFVVIAEDEVSYRFLSQTIPNHVVKSVEFGRPYSQEGKKIAELDSSNFNWCSRPIFLLAIINAGFTALWIDSDAVVMSNPFEAVDLTSPVVLTDDWPYRRPLTEYKSYLCSCFVLARPAPQARALLSLWSRKCGNSTNDQPPLNEALLELKDTSLGAWTIADRRLVPNGHDAEQYTMKRAPGWDEPLWLHANWRKGRDAKVDFLKSAGKWISSDTRGVFCDDLAS